MVKMNKIQAWEKFYRSSIEVFRMSAEIFKTTGEDYAYLLIIWAEYENIKRKEDY